MSGFGADLGLWWGRRGARRAFGSRRSAPAVPTASLGGRRLAKYCASNARRAAMTVGPIPTIPSSMLGRATRSKARCEKVIEDGAQRTDCRDEPRNKVPSVPSLPLRGPSRGADAECDRCFSSSAPRKRTPRRNWMWFFSC